MKMRTEQRYQDPKGVKMRIGRRYQDPKGVKMRTGRRYQDPKGMKMRTGQSIPPTTADKQTQAQKRRGSRSRKLLGAKAKSYRIYVLLNAAWATMGGGLGEGLRGAR